MKIEIKKDCRIKLQIVREKIKQKAMFTECFDKALIN